MRGEIKDERGRIIGYIEGCSRGSTGPLCKACKSGTSEYRCAYTSRLGKCDAYICSRCVALLGDVPYCPAHRERMGLGPPPSVARHREHRAQVAARKAARAKQPPRWIERSFKHGRCKQCERSTQPGERILYFGADYTLMCETCGESFQHAARGESGRKMSTLEEDTSTLPRCFDCAQLERSPLHREQGGQHYHKFRPPFVTEDVRETLVYLGISVEAAQELWSASLGDAKEFRRQVLEFGKLKGLTVESVMDDAASDAGSDANDASLYAANDAGDADD